MCGIFGIINRHKRLLDKRAFITLGCANDTRGGDACGIMIDGLVERGTEKSDKYFELWYPKSQVLKETEKCYVALGHCRKASTGGVSADKAQPITIYDDNNKLLFCMIHNGTIYNYENLAKKFIPNIDIKGLNDSQVMAQIFFHAGYDALLEYEGGGAFVIQDYRINKTFVFKGKSKAKYSDKTATVERPLYFVETGKSIIFSSIDSILQGLYWNFTVYEVPENMLLECNGVHFYKVKDYDRSECYGFRVTPFQKKNDMKNLTTLYYGYNDELNALFEEAMYECKEVYSKVGFNINSGTYTNAENKWLLHGIVNINQFGRIVSYDSVYNKKYYFWRGIMVSGENAYNAIRNFFTKHPKDPKKVMKLAMLLSCNPVSINKHFFVFDAKCHKMPFVESYVFPLTNIEIICNNYGKIIATYEDKKNNAFVPINLNKEQVDKIVEYVNSI